MPMICPKCTAEMRHYERSGVTVDQCSECRGIFLDRGELERLTDAESAWQGERRTPEPARPNFDDRQHNQYRKKKRGSFFEELFD
jgi:Zn-finger nucleic acid-binding protein